MRAALGGSCEIKQRQRVSGGSINHCERFYLADGRQVFAKTHRHQPVSGMYEAEAHALELLAASKTLPVPAVIYADDELLLLEALDEGVPGSDWQEALGRGLALLHKKTRQKQYGLELDNFIGLSPQPNGWHDDWVSFWQTRRLGHQISLFASKTRAGDALVTACSQLQEKLPELLAADDEPAVLLHGDLWSGNAAATPQGKPVIFDPASYYGHREAEFGMMRLFGGFGARCEAAYQEVWPFQPGVDRRIALYQLYHQLNHLNLFGPSYYDGCLSTARSLL